VARVFLMLGCVAFGGPVAHVALMRREIVARRRWLPEGEFLRMFAACNLIPGPSSTELAIFLGYRRGGWRALVLAGVLFIAPAALLMLAIAWAYATFQGATATAAILHGIRPVVVGIIAWAAQDLGRRVLGRPVRLLVAAAAGALLLWGANPILLLAAGGLLLAALSFGPRRLTAYLAALPLGVGTPDLGRLPLLFLTFLKFGAVAFGSGYVLIAFLRSDLVVTLHWLTDQQLLDAIAIGQATPGPVFATATFIGYLVAGVPGAILATVGIFLPGFLFVPFLDRLVAVVERRRWTQAFFDGVNAVVLGLIVAVTVELGRASLVDPPTAALAMVAFLVSLRWPLAAPVLILGGAAAGLLLGGR
jgi:chromate transporter